MAAERRARRSEPADPRYRLRGDRPNGYCRAARRPRVWSWSLPGSTWRPSTRCVWTTTEKRDGDVELRHLSEGCAVVSGSAMDLDGCIYLGTSDGIWLLREPSCDRELVASPDDVESLRAENRRRSTSRTALPATAWRARAGRVPSCSGSDRLTEPDPFYIQTILEGRALSAGMPAWGAAGMSEEQARAIARVPAIAGAVRQSGCCRSSWL